MFQAYVSSQVELLHAGNLLKHHSDRISFKTDLCLLSKLHKRKREKRERKLEGIHWKKRNTIIRSTVLPLCQELCKESIFFYRKKTHMGLNSKSIFILGWTILSWLPSWTAGLIFLFNISTVFALDGSAMKQWNEEMKKKKWD